MEYSNPQSLSNSLFGGQTPTTNIQMTPNSAAGPNSVITQSLSYSNTPFFNPVAGPGSVGSFGVGGPSSVYNNQMLNASSNLNTHQAEAGTSAFSEYKSIGSVMNLAGIPTSERVSQYLEPASVAPASLAVPMTPLHGADHAAASNHGMVPSNQAMLIPATPLSVAADIPMPTLQNIVSTVNLGVQLDLKKIAMHARNAEYNPKRFAAVIMRIREPRTTALIFSSGKMVCTGAKSEETSRLAARKYARIIQKLGFEAKFTEFKVQNMVGSCDVKFPIQLEGLCITHAQFSTYEPELFPGLIYRMVKPRVVLLIFVSGKVVITGAKYKKDIDDAFNQIYPILKGFKK